MWALENNTPFAAERTWVRDRDGSEVWIVAVKATFLIQDDGTTALAPEQAPIERVPRYRGDPAKSSLICESDLVPTKLTTDILLDGCAYAPQGKPTQQVDVTLKVATLSKTLRVTGDRYWKIGALSIRATAPEPFVKMPLTYERAFGGTDQQHGWEKHNPVGTGFAVRAGHLADQRLPNIEDLRDRAGLGKMRCKPVGFGPIARHWAPRVEFAGTYDAKWQRERFPLPPEDFQDRFYQCAPADQQTPQYLKGGESVELLNLTPRGTLQFHLPKMTLGFATQFTDGLRTHHRAVLHTVLLEPEVPQVILVWHTRLPCHPRVQKLRQTTIVRKVRLPSAGAQPQSDEADEE